MSDQKPLRVVLCSLTGFGNTVLPALLRDPRVQVAALFTHIYEKPFPYYRETALADLSRELKVPYHAGFPVSSERGLALLKSYEPDLVLVASFREILHPAVIAIPTRSTVNMHSSLLPKYRGVCPGNAVLLQGESRTGMTVHYVTPTIDAGDILLQKEITIAPDETDSSLRKKFAVVAGAMVPDIISLFWKEKHPHGTPQDARAVTAAPRPLPEDGYLERCRDVMDAERRVRTLNPFPGTSILLGKERILVNRSVFLEGTKSDGIFLTGEKVELWRDGRGLSLWQELTGETWCM